MTADLLDLARAGDEEAFRELLEPYRRELEVHCYRMLGSCADAEDVMQEALLAAWQGLGRFEGRSPIRTWLYRIATTRCLNARRSARRHRAAAAPPGIRPPPPTGLGRSYLARSLSGCLLDRLPAADPGPEARYEAREAMSLAFITAVRKGATGEVYRARVRWMDPFARRRKSLSQVCSTMAEADSWIAELQQLAQAGGDPLVATMTLSDYGDSVMPLALRGLESKTLDPYLAGWRKRVVPTLGHLPVRMISHGAVDRAVRAWIADEASRSTVKNSLAILVRVLEQARRDGIVEHNRGRVTGWQREFRRAEDELDNPRLLALPNWDALQRLGAALVARSHGRFAGWADIVEFTACTAARIGETSGVRRADINRQVWTWNVRRQTTTAPGGVVDKGTKGKRARVVPIIPEIRPLVDRRLNEVSDDPMARLFTGPRGGRVTTAILRDATHWDEVVTALGYDYLRRHDLRHTGLTWMADAGVPVHVLRKIAGHGSLTTTQRYLHPDHRAITDAGEALSAYLNAG